MKAKDFIVVRRPMLAKITKHPTIEFGNYERRLESMQFVMQSIQQAYLGTRERAVIVLEGWDTAGKGGIVRRLGWALDPRSFKVYPMRRRCRTNAADTTCNAFGKSCRTPDKS
jgi:AMP-polyphosphate phosphotransferase